MRTLAIGDIHGGFRAIQQLLERVNYDPTKDKLIFVGDYVDGWSETKQVIDFLCKLHEENNSIVFIRGNHDQWMIDFIEGGGHIAVPLWVNQGGRETLESYGAHIMPQMSDYMVDVDIPDSHKEFLLATELFHIDKQNRGFVHGGYNSFEGLGHDEPYVYMWDRDIAHFLPMRSSDPTPRILRPHKELYIGHTTTLMWKTTKPICLHGKYFNIDTGGGWGGKLTAIDIDTKQVYQSDFVKDLYPNEKGR
jgi:serine/threonine protein phosphatase 1